MNIQKIIAERGEKMIFLEAKGRYACFTKAEAKVERQSQEIITPSAARGLIESVF